MLKSLLFELFSGYNIFLLLSNTEWILKNHIRWLPTYFLDFTEMCLVNNVEILLLLLFSEVQEALSGYIEKNPSSWAPMVSKWSLDTLGTFSYSLII